MSFSIPGLLLGLIIALVLNEAFLEMAMLFMVPGFYSEYGLQTQNIVIVSVLMGLILPLIANIGPTRDALQRNLR